jgi:adhesin transport system membrane fusion protein
MKDKKPPKNNELLVNAQDSSQKAKARVAGVRKGKGNYVDENDSLDHKAQSIGAIEVQKPSAESGSKNEAVKAHMDGDGKITFGKPLNEDDEDVEFMSPVTGAFKSKPKTWGSILLYTIITFFILAITWSFFAELDQITRGQGQVIPSGQVKLIDHLEGGIIKEIKIKEGDIVEKGQVLLLVDATVAKEKYADELISYYRTEAQIARLKAQSSGKPFVVPEDVQKNAPDIAEKEMSLYQDALKRMENERKIAANEVEQRKQEALEVRAHVEQLENRLKIAQKALDLMEPLVKSGVSPQIEWLKLQRDVSDTKGDLAASRASVPKAEAAVLEANQKIDQVEINIRTEENRELRDAQMRWTDLKNNRVKDLDQLQRTEIRSPVRGTIKELKINTIGSVVQPGRDLIAIVPLEDQLLVEAQVQPSDVAFLRPGMKAVVKITAYDYGIYGGLNGTLMDISADTIVDEKNKDRHQYYRIRVKTDKNYLGTDTKRLPIFPGMIAQVDILTGKKTVWQYIMKPILKAKSNALTER